MEPGEIKMYPRTCVITLYFFLALILLAGCGGGKEAAVTPTIVEPQARLDQSWTIMVVPFDTAGKTKITGQEAMDLLMAELIGMDGYKVVDRNSMQEMMTQRGFAMSDLGDSAGRNKVAGLLGAQLMCSGSINEKLKLVTVKVSFVATGETLFVVTSREKDELKNIGLAAQKLKLQLGSSKTVAFLNKESEPPEKEALPPVNVQVKGYGAIIDGDLIMARELALKDAYAKAIEQGCGVKLIRETQVKNYQLVQDKIFTESVGFVTSYEIAEEKPDGEFGYEVTVQAVVSREPIADLDKLQLVVEYLLTQPRVAVLVEGDVGGEEISSGRAAVIAGQISVRLQKAGFSVVDAKAIEEKKKEFADSLDKDEAARLGSLLDANVIVKSEIHSAITDRVEEIDGKKLDFPNLTATTTGVLQIIHPETADILSVFSHEELPDRSNKGFGTTDDAAIGQSLDNFIDAAANKLAWELAAKLGGPVKLWLVLDKVTLEQAENFEQQLKGVPEELVISATMLLYDKNKANYQLETIFGSRELQKKLLKLLDPASLDAEELMVDKVEPGTINLSLR